jgi:hypothetical protein
VTELDRVLPEWDFGERHTIRVEAPPDAVFGAVRAVTLSEMGVFRVLAWLRGIRVPADRPIVEVAGAAWSVLADVPGRELVLGAVGQPWRLRGGDSPGSRRLDGGSQRAEVPALPAPEPAGGASRPSTVPAT